MAMDGDTLGQAIADAIVDSGASSEGKAQCVEFWKKVAKQIVSHIQANAEVPAGIAVSTAGSPTAQTGSTTSAGSVL